MKRYLQKTLKDTLATWIVLVAGIVSSSILYAILIIKEVPENTSLLIAFLALIALIILGLIAFPTDSFMQKPSVSEQTFMEQSLSKSAEKEVDKPSALTRSKVFISYSHRDIHLLERLLVHLMPFEREGMIDIWDDTKIAAGDTWDDEIMKALKGSRVAVLLVSADYLASDFIREYELPTLLEQAKRGETTIIPVIVSPSFFTNTDLNMFHAFNAPREPISLMSRSKQDEIFEKLAQYIKDQFKTGEAAPRAIDNST